MNRVFLCSPTNSTMFTSCCETAICDDQACCPRCGEEVHPGHEATQHQRSIARWEMAYGPTRRAQAARAKHLAALAFFIFAHVYTVTEDAIAHRSPCKLNDFCKDEIK